MSAPPLGFMGTVAGADEAADDEVAVDGLAGSLEVISFGALAPQAVSIKAENKIAGVRQLMDGKLNLIKTPSNIVRSAAFRWNGDD
ncbi:MAG: hypothetical protein KA368_16930 [Acidobacteria bacterium]|nr:hypothetical protein [Acidobacteriota bacterium]